MVDDVLGLPSSNCTSKSLLADERAVPNLGSVGTSEGLLNEGRGFTLKGGFVKRDAFAGPRTNSSSSEESFGVSSCTGSFFDRDAKAAVGIANPFGFLGTGVLLRENSKSSSSSNSNSLHAIEALLSRSRGMLVAMEGVKKPAN